MRVRDAGAVAIRRSADAGCIFVLLERGFVSEPCGCALSLAPVALAAGPCACAAAGLRWRPLRARPLRLDVIAAPRHLAARFSRVIELPAPLRGLGLGTYLMSTLVRRAVALGFGAARVRSLHLLKRQDTPLRNAFYRCMGFDLALYADGSGWARARRLDQLRTAHDPAKLRELPPPPAASLALGPQPVYTRLPPAKGQGAQPWK